MEQLTDEQREIIENSLWVVNAVLKKMGLLANEDFRQSGILYLCKCLLRYDKNKKIKWTTYAYRNVYLYIKRIAQDERHYQSAIAEEGLDYWEEIIGEETYVDDGLFYKGLVEKIKEQCTEKEKQILEMKVQGKLRKEIAQSLNCSATLINLRMKKIRERTEKIKEKYRVVKNGE